MIIKRIDNEYKALYGYGCSHPWADVAYSYNCVCASGRHDNGAFYFDENNKLHINFDRFHDVVFAMLKETIEVQLSKSSEKAKAFIDKYTNWGKHSQYIAEVQKELGVKNYIVIKDYF